MLLQSDLDVQQAQLSWGGIVEHRSYTLVAQQCDLIHINDSYKFCHTKVTPKCTLLFNKLASEAALFSTEVRFKQDNTVWSKYYLGNCEFGHTLVCFLSQLLSDVYRQNIQKFDSNILSWELDSWNCLLGTFASFNKLSCVRLVWTKDHT